MSISEDAFQFGNDLAGACGASLPRMLNDALGHFIGGHYKAVSGCVIDRDGRKSETFASVIYRASGSADPADPRAVPADATAAVIDACDELNLESFRSAYGRIA